MWSSRMSAPPNTFTWEEWDWNKTTEEEDRKRFQPDSSPSSPTWKRHSSLQIGYGRCGTRESVFSRIPSHGNSEIVISQQRKKIGKNFSRTSAGLRPSLLHPEKTVQLADGLWKIWNAWMSVLPNTLTREEWDCAWRQQERNETNKETKKAS